MRALLALFLCATLAACTSRTPSTTVSTSESPATVRPDMPDYRYDPPATEGQITPVTKTEEEWRELLSPEAYAVLREDGTERSFTSPLLNEKRPGVFSCAACGLPLFASETKYKSGTGWPSFYQPIHPDYIREDVDTRYGMRRVEVSCARCNGHQGHVFPDGPEPTGLRYCINGVSLNFVPQEDLGTK